MTTTMAEVLAEHQYKPAGAVCACSDFVQVGLKCDKQTHPEHVAEVLTAAGFGLVADAKAEAWGEGHESGFWNGRESAGHHEMRYVGLEHAQLNNPYSAAAVRGEG